MVVDPICFTPIGVVRNDQPEATDEGWGSVESVIDLRPDLAGIAEGLDQFSHALILYYMHETPPVDQLKRRPRGMADMPELGLLAQRARHRPNPIGVTAVEILGVTSHAITVRGLDAINGTPILDIKPYYPQFDQRTGARVPEWVGRLMMGYFQR